MYQHKKKSQATQATPLPAAKKPKLTPEQQTIQRAKAKFLAIQRQKQVWMGGFKQTVTPQRDALTPVLAAGRFRTEHEQAIQREKQAAQTELSTTQAALPAPEVIQRLQASSEQQNVPPAQRTRDGRLFIPTMQAATQHFNEQISVQRKKSPNGSVPLAHWQSAARTTTSALVNLYQTSKAPAAERQQELASSLAGISDEHDRSRLASVTLSQIKPAVDGPVIQRMLDERIAEQSQKDGILSNLATVQRQLEQGLNTDLSGVRIHADHEADKLSKSVGAVAFTTGTDIFFSVNKYDPHSTEGFKLLAHETTHVKQELQGRASAGIDADAGLEAEARRAETKLSNLKPASKKAPRKVAAKPATQTARTTRALQRKQEPTDVATLKQGVRPSNPVGVVWHSDKKVKLRETIGGKEIGFIPNETRLYLIQHDTKQQAFYVRTPTGLVGWVAASHIKVAPVSDANIRFYVPKANESIFKLTGTVYGAKEGGDDARYFTNVLRKVNKPDAFYYSAPERQGVIDSIVSPIADKTIAGHDANHTHLKQGVPIWLPSPAAAKSVQAPTGSISKTVLAAAEKTFGDAGVAAILSGAFQIGTTRGLLTNLWDVLVGLWDTIKLPYTALTSVWKLLQSSFSEIWGQVVSIFEYLKNGGLAEIAKTIKKSFLAQWNHSNQIRAWEFRGMIVGYTVTEIITTFIPVAGIAMKAVKATGLAKKFGGLFSKLLKTLKAAAAKITRAIPPGAQKAAQETQGVAQKTAQIQAKLEAKYGKPVVTALLQKFKGNTTHLTRALNYFGDAQQLERVLQKAGSPEVLLKLINGAQTQKLTANQLEAALTTLGPVLPRFLKRSESELAAGLKLADLERADMGHALDRHGPDLTDIQLKDRITTGIAPDGMPSPTHTSTRFTSYTMMLKAREYAKLEAARVGYRGIPVDLNQPPSPALLAISPPNASGQIRLPKVTVDVSSITSSQSVGSGFTVPKYDALGNETNLRKWVSQGGAATPMPGQPNKKVYPSSVVAPVVAPKEAEIALTWDGSKWIIGQFFPKP